MTNTNPFVSNSLLAIGTINFSKGRVVGGRGGGERRGDSERRRGEAMAPVGEGCGRRP